MDIDPSLITDVIIKNKISGTVQRFSSTENEFTFQVNRKARLTRDLQSLIFAKLPLKEQVQFTKINNEHFSQLSITKLYDYELSSFIIKKGRKRSLMPPKPEIYPNFIARAKAGYGSITGRLMQKDLEKVNPRTQKLYWLDLQILNITDNKLITDLSILSNLKIVNISFTSYNKGKIGKNVKVIDYTKYY